MLELAKTHVPTIRHTDISWRTVGSFVEIGIVLTNELDEPTQDDELVIEAAPFGAFVPFEPVKRIAVPGFAPRERRRLMTRVDREQLDARSAVPNAILTPASWVPAGFCAQVFNSVTRWVGNLNVYFDCARENAVERHCAFGLGLQPEEKAGFRFLVEGPCDYAIEANPSDPRWKAEAAMFLDFFGVARIDAPAEAGLKATVDVLVTWRSDERTVRVEFHVETVEGPGDTLGCIRIGCTTSL